MVWATHGGSSGGCRPDLYSGDVYGGGARHLFEEMPSHREATPGGVLLATVSHVLYPVNEEVLHQVFDAYGAEQVVVLERADHVEVLVRFRSGRDVERARDVTHGRCIYDGCCWLDVQCMQPTPSDSVVATPATCSTLGLSHDSDVLMTTTTPAVAALTTLTTSAAATTTSLATGARGALGDEFKELAPKETSKEPKKTVQELCEQILDTLNRMIEGGRDANLDITSNAVEPVGHSVVSSPTRTATVKLSDIIVSSPAPPVATDSVRGRPEDSDDYKVFEQILDKSTMVLWPLSMKMTEWQPYTPPVQVEVMGEKLPITTVVLEVIPWALSRWEQYLGHVLSFDVLEGFKVTTGVPDAKRMLHEKAKPIAFYMTRKMPYSCFRCTLYPFVQCNNHELLEQLVFEFLVPDKIKPHPGGSYRKLEVFGSGAEPTSLLLKILSVHELQRPWDPGGQDITIASVHGIKTKENAGHAPPNSTVVQVISRECIDFGMINCTNDSLETVKEVGHQVEREDSFDEYQDTSPFLHQSDSEDGAAVAHHSEFYTEIKNLNIVSLQQSVATNEIPVETNVLCKDHFSREPSMSDLSADSKVGKEVECYSENRSPGWAER